MSYNEVVEEFDPIKAYNARIKHANMTRDLLVTSWKKAYEAFWQTPRTHKDRALSMAELQSIIDVNQATFGAILADSAAFVQFAAAQYPEALVGTDGGEALLPSRYLASPYIFEGSPGVNLTLVSLVPEWSIQ